jgi:hypothetical protein
MPPPVRDSDAEGLTLADAALLLAFFTFLAFLTSGGARIAQSRTRVQRAESARLACELTRISFACASIPTTNQLFSARNIESKQTRGERDAAALLLRRGATVPQPPR